MLKKLIKGELSLGTAFWKFGVLGLILINFVVRVFGIILAGRLKGVTILDYYTKFFSVVNYDLTTLMMTLVYLALISSLVSYCYIVVVGVWKSSAEYDKSIWLRFISRVLIIIFAIISIRSIF